MVPLAALARDRRPGVEGDIAVLAHPHDGALDELIPVDAAVGVAWQLHREDHPVPLLPLLLFGKRGIGVEERPDPRLESALIAAYQPGRGVGDPAFSRVGLRVQRVASAMMDAVVPGILFRLLHRRRLEPEGVLQRLLDGRPFHQVEAQYHALALPVDGESALGIGGRPVLLRLAEPREASLLIA